MFHRVKSEVEESQENQTGQQGPAKHPGYADAYAREAEKKSSEKVEEKAAPSGSAKQTPIQEKETKPMNAQENTKENEQTEAKQEPSQTRSYGIQGSNYQQQRPQSSTSSAAPSAAPGAYPGAYPGSSYNARSAAEAAHDSDRTLTIGAGITMSGEIESCDNLVVEGTVEAALKGAKVLDIYETGTFYGTVEIEDATIAGRFEGDLTATGRLVIRQGGSVTGTIAYRELEVESGAIIDGKLVPLKGVQSESVQRPKIKEVAATRKAHDENQPPANSDGEGLFSEKAAAE